MFTVWIDGEEWEGRQRVLATHKVFDTREEAEVYANGVHRGLCPSIMPLNRQVEISVKQQDTKEFTITLAVHGITSLETANSIKDNFVRLFNLEKGDH